MCEEKEKIILPEELQEQMMKFFLKTSIPRKKRKEQEKCLVLSENQNTDGSGEHGNKKGAGSN